MWAVVTIPRREPLADALIAQLRQPALKVLDTTGDVQQSHVRAWREVCAFDCDWVGVLQDDLILCDDFDRKVRRRLAEAGELGYRAVSFYNNAHSDAYLVREGERWGRMDLRLLEGIRREPAGDRMIRSVLQGELCVAVRREVALRYSGFVERHRELYRMFPGVHDGLFGLFLNSQIGNVADLDAIVTNHVRVALPNLVNHRTDVESSLSHFTHHRARSSSTFRPDAE